MRRTWALLTTTVVLRASSAAALPLDLDLSRLGSPRVTDGVTAEAAARSRREFALLSSELALAMTSQVFGPAATTGPAGLAVDLELALAPVGGDGGGSGLASGQESWPTRGPAPGLLLLPSLHVRKGLPFGIELGGRARWIARSSMVALEGELRWALVEGHAALPDLSFRGALTRLFNQRDLNLDARELGVVMGKKLGVSGTWSLAPYAGVRLTWVRASSDPIEFGSAAGASGTQAAFPELQFHDHRLLRISAGVRVVASGVALGIEGTWLPKREFAVGDGSRVELGPSFSGGVSVGFER
jgi:hypothetical protein